MRWRILMRANSPDEVISALKRARVKFVIDGTRLDQAPKRGAQDPATAAAIYKQIKAGEPYAVIAGRHEVSYYTVLRVARNPRAYGVDAEPVRRKPRK